jgi:DNA-binding IclR family transcriptional regulator
MTALAQSITGRPVRIQSLARASAILNVLASAAADGSTLAHVSQSVGLRKSTVHNLLASLVALGFVEQSARTRSYRLGLRNLELGRIVHERLDLIGAVEPSLIRLSARTRETVSFAVPHGMEVLIVKSHEGDHAMRIAAYPGTRVYYHSSACGKSILAHLSPPARRAILTSRPLVALTPHTICDLVKLEKELDRVRARGYATNIEESAEGSSCVAASIFGPFGEVAGAISVDAPSSRLARRRIQEVGAWVRDEVVKISAALASGGRLAPDDHERRRDAERGVLHR